MIAIDLKTAQLIAREFLSLIYTGCEQATICGSVRREKPDDIKDIEIVARPRFYKVAASLFGDVELKSELEDLLGALLATGTIALYVDEHGTVCNGSKHKKLVFKDAMIDLYTAERGNWGNIVAIRTGNADFSRLLVTQRSAGGFMPSHLRQREGYLWKGDQPIDCLTEQDFFRALELEWMEPRDRNEKTARLMLRKPPFIHTELTGVLV